MTLVESAILALVEMEVVLVVVAVAYLSATKKQFHFHEGDRVGALGYETVQ